MDQAPPQPVERDGRDGWVARLQAGLVGGLLTTIFGLAHASLITGAAAPEATFVVIGMTLLGTAVLCVVLGTLSRFKGIVPMVQDVPSAALGAILVALLAERSAQGDGVAVAEVVILCWAGGLAMAVATFVFGSLRLASVMRFAPRPVLAGFLSGTGYFVILGALGICLGGTLDPAALTSLLTPTALAKLGCALGVCAALIGLSRVLPTNLVLALSLGGGIVAVHVIAVVFQVPHSSLAVAGWFAQLPASGLAWPPVGWAEVAAVDLGFLAQQVLPLVTMVLLTTAALLVYTSALEAQTRRELDLDRELKALGVTNLLVTAVGGMFGTHAASTTLAAARIATPHVSVSYIAAGFVLTVFVFGNTVLSVLPLPVLAGFMLWIGLDFLRDFLVREVYVTPRGEAALTVVIFLAIVGFGLFEGTLFGLVAGCGLFIYNYSRLDPLRSVLTGDAFHSARERDRIALGLLKRHGKEIVVMKLQGYVFFGTAYTVRKRILARSATQPLRHLVLDFAAVTGLDSTAAESFKRLAEDLEGGLRSLTVTGMSPEVAQVFGLTGDRGGKAQPVVHVPDLNTALAQVEEQILAEARAGQGTDDTPPSLRHLLKGFLGGADSAEALERYLTPRTLPPGADIVKRGSAGRDIFFVETGEAEVLIGPPEARTPVRTLGAGAIIGELSYYRRMLRSTTVRALTETRVWQITSEDLDRMLEEAPVLSNRFHFAMAKMLSERVSANTRLIQMLQE